MLHAVSIWFLVVAFFGAGVFNAVGTPVTTDSFVRWGYPRWWHRATGGLEVATAVLIAIQTTRGLGLILGAVIISSAVYTVLRHREFSHLTPLSFFFVLLMLAGITS